MNVAIYYKYNNSVFWSSVSENIEYAFKKEEIQPDSISMCLHSLLMMQSHKIFSETSQKAIFDQFLECSNKFIKQQNLSIERAYSNKSYLNNIKMMSKMVQRAGSI